MQPVSMPQVCQTQTGQIVTVQPTVQPAVMQPIVVQPQVCQAEISQPVVVQAVPEPIVQPVQTIVWVTKPTEYVNCPTGLGFIIFLFKKVKIIFRISSSC